MQLPEPGSVWWCDGIALSFEARFKRRPVLVLGVREGMETREPEIVVAPLSSRRRYGQEQEVAHQKGVSYLTGTIGVVPPDALLSPLGIWEGFPAWAAAQNRERSAGSGVGAALRRLYFFVVGWFKKEKLTSENNI